MAEECFGGTRVEFVANGVWGTTQTKVPQERNALLLFYERIEAPQMGMPRTDSVLSSMGAEVPPHTPAAPLNASTDSKRCADAGDAAVVSAVASNGAADAAVAPVELVSALDLLASTKDEILSTNEHTVRQCQRLDPEFFRHVIATLVPERYGGGCHLCSFPIGKGCVLHVRARARVCVDCCRIASTLEAPSPYLQLALFALVHSALRMQNTAFAESLLIKIKEVLQRWAWVCCLPVPHVSNCCLCSRRRACSDVHGAGWFMRAMTEGVQPAPASGLLGWHCIPLPLPAFFQVGLLTHPVVRVRRAFLDFIMRVVEGVSSQSSEQGLVVSDMAAISTATALDDTVAAAQQKVATAGETYTDLYERLDLAKQRLGTAKRALEHEQLMFSAYHRHDDDHNAMFGLGLRASDELRAQAYQTQVQTMELEVERLEADLAIARIQQAEARQEVQAAQAARAGVTAVSGRSTLWKLVDAWLTTVPVAMTQWRQFEEFLRLPGRLLQCSVPVVREYVARSSVALTLCNMVVDNADKFYMHALDPTPDYRPALQSLVELLRNHAEVIPPRILTSLTDPTLLNRLALDDVNNDAVQALCSVRVLGDLRAFFHGVEDAQLRAKASPADEAAVEPSSGAASRGSSATAAAAAAGGSVAGDLETGSDEDSLSESKSEVVGPPVAARSPPRPPPQYKAPASLVSLLNLLKDTVYIRPPYFRAVVRLVSDIEPKYRVMLLRMILSPSHGGMFAPPEPSIMTMAHHSRFPVNFVSSFRLVLALALELNVRSRETPVPEVLAHLEASLDSWKALPLTVNEDMVLFQLPRMVACDTPQSWRDPCLRLFLPEPVPEALLTLQRHELAMRLNELGRCLAIRRQVKSEIVKFVREQRPLRPHDAVRRDPQEARVFPPDAVVFQVTGSPVSSVNGFYYALQGVQSDNAPIFEKRLGSTVVQIKRYFVSMTGRQWMIIERKPRGEDVYYSNFSNAPMPPSLRWESPPALPRFKRSEDVFREHRLAVRQVNPPVHHDDADGKDTDAAATGQADGYGSAEDVESDDAEEITRTPLHPGLRNVHGLYNQGRARGAAFPRTPQYATQAKVDQITGMGFTPEQATK